MLAGIRIHWRHGRRYRLAARLRVGKRLPAWEPIDFYLRLKAELRRVTEERDILKKAAAYFARG